MTTVWPFSRTAPAPSLHNMRLAIVSSHPIQYYAPLFRELAKRVDLHVFFAHDATPADQSRAGFGTAFRWDVDLTSGYAHTFLRNVSRSPGTDHFDGCDAPDIFEHLGGSGFEAVLITGWHLKVYIQALFAAKRLGLPVLVRGDSQLQTPRSRLTRAIKDVVYPPFLRLFDAALYVGNRSREYYDHYHFPQNRLFFSPHCIDNDWFAERATADSRRALREKHRISPETHLMIFAGKLVPFKRPLDVVDAAGICRRRGRNVEVLVAGAGELKESILARGMERAVPIHYLGFCNQSEMPGAYAASDVLVLPSTGQETWGLVVNEALACGRPAITSDACGCAPDLSARSGAGRVYPCGDVEALALEIEHAIESPPTPEAIRQISQKYSLGASADGIQSALSELVRPSRRQIS